MSDEEESPLKFPCEFPIKAMGKTHCNLDIIVAGIVRKHVPDLGENAIKTRTSAQGNYLAVTATITATSRQQLDAIYQDLVDCDAVIMAI